MINFYKIINTNNQYDYITLNEMEVSFITQKENNEKCSYTPVSIKGFFRALKKTKPEFFDKAIKNEIYKYADRFINDYVKSFRVYVDPVKFREGVEDIYKSKIKEFNKNKISDRAAE